MVFSGAVLLFETKPFHIAKVCLCGGGCLFLLYFVAPRLFSDDERGNKTNGAHNPHLQTDLLSWLDKQRAESAAGTEGYANTHKSNAISLLEPRRGAYRGIAACLDSARVHRIRQSLKRGLN